MGGSRVTEQLWLFPDLSLGGGDPLTNLKVRSVHTQRLEPTTTYISPSSMLRDSDGDIGGGKFTRSGSYALSSYFLPLRPLYLL